REAQRLGVIFDGLIEVGDVHPDKAEADDAMIWGQILGAGGEAQSDDGTGKEKSKTAHGSLPVVRVCLFRCLQAVSFCEGRVTDSQVSTIRAWPLSRAPFPARRSCSAARDLWKSIRHGARCKATEHC